MRFIQAVLLLLFLGVILVFIVQNNQSLTLRFLDRNLITPVPLLIVATYVLGMLSGWTVVAFLRRSIRTVTERRAD